MELKCEILKVINKDHADSRFPKDFTCENRAINMIGDYVTGENFYICDDCYYQVFPSSNKIRGDSSFI